MPMFRKKPVIIEAVQFARGNFDEIEKFVGGDAMWRDGQMTIATLEGAMHASDNDWVIKGVKGEFYPCKPDIFAATYEPAEVFETKVNADGTWDADGKFSIADRK